MVELARKFFPAIFTLATAFTGPFISPSLAASMDEGSVERGRYLVEHVMYCGLCHNPGAFGASDQVGPGIALSGGSTLHSPVGDLHLPNITSDRETGIGAWTDAELASAIRDGRRRDGSLMLPFMPWPNYNALTDSDLASIIKYLRQTPAVSNAVPASEISILAKIGLKAGIGLPDRSPRIERTDGGFDNGKYLSELGHCAMCHTPMRFGLFFDYDNLYAGGNEIHYVRKPTVSSNITPDPGDGIGSWDAAALESSLREGVGSSAQLQSPMFEITLFLKDVEKSDMNDLKEYMKTIQPRADP